jgi:hypothetical protein
MSIPEKLRGDSIGQGSAVTAVREWEAIPEATVVKLLFMGKCAREWIGCRFSRECKF